MQDAELDALREAVGRRVVHQDAGEPHRESEHAALDQRQREEPAPESTGEHERRRRERDLRAEGQPSVRVVRAGQRACSFGDGARVKLAGHAVETEDRVEPRGHTGDHEQRGERHA